MLILQSTLFSLLFKLVDGNGNPVTGLPATAVTGFIKKQGATSFTAIPVNTSVFAENGNGYYSLNLSTAQTDTIGSLYVLLKGALFQDNVLGLTVVTTGTTIAPTPVDPVPTGTIYGYITGPSGSPYAGAAVTANVLSTPVIVSVGNENVGVTNTQISTKTDTSGYFLITAVSGTVVEVWIPALNFRKVVAVPTTSINLFSA